MNTDTSFGLVKLAQAGDTGACDRLVLRYLARLRIWATHRLPRWARENNDTEDMVQETLANAFRNLQQVRMRHPASLRAYMRRALDNRINDEIRRARRRPAAVELPEAIPADAPTELQRAISRQDLARCRTALARLSQDDRRIIGIRLSHGDITFKQLAALTGKSSEDAARVALARAIKRLAAEMERLETAPPMSQPTLGAQRLGSRNTHVTRVCRS